MPAQWLPHGRCLFVCLFVLSLLTKAFSPGRSVTSPFWRLLILTKWVIKLWGCMVFMDAQELASSFWKKKNQGSVIKMCRSRIIPMEEFVPVCSFSKAVWYGWVSPGRENDSPQIWRALSIAQCASTAVMASFSPLHGTSHSLRLLLCKIRVSWSTTWGWTEGEIKYVGKTLRSFNMGVCVCLSICLYIWVQVLIANQYLKQVHLLSQFL